MQMYVRCTENVIENTVYLVIFWVFRFSLFNLYIHILKIWIWIKESIHRKHNSLQLNQIELRLACHVHLQSFTHRWPLAFSISHAQWHPGTGPYVSHTRRNKPSPGFWACKLVVSLPRSAIPRKSGTLRQTVGRCSSHYLFQVRGAICQ